MKLKTILHYIIIGGLFLIPFVPLIVLNSLYFPFIVGKAFAFRILVEIIFAAWLVLMLLDRRYRPKLSWISGSIGVFLFVIMLANIFGLNPYFSFWSNFERMEGFVTLLHLGAFFVVLGSFFNEKLWQRFFHISLGVSIFISFYSLSQIFGWIDIRQGGARVDGTMGNAIYLALYLMFHFFIALFYFFKAQKYKFAYLLIIFLNLIIIYFTASRGVILGLGLGLLIAFLLIFILEKERKILRRNIGIALLSLVILIGGFLFVKDSNFVRKNQTLGRFSELTKVDAIKSQGRFMIWPMATTAFKDSPILGYGQENFNFVFNRYYNPKVFNQEPWFDRVHNTFLDWLVVGGILGLLSYITILFSLFFALWSSSASVIDKSVLTGLLTGYIFQSIFVFDNLTSYIFVYAIFGYIWHLETNILNSNQKEIKINEKPIRYFVLPIILIVLVYGIYFVNVRALRANAALIRAIHPESLVEDSLSSYQKVFDINSFGGRETLFQFLDKTIRVNRDGNVAPHIKEEYLKLAETQVKSITDKYSFDTRTFLVVGSFYSNMSNLARELKDESRAENYFEKSVQFLEKAKEISPKRQDVYFEIGSSYFSHNDLVSSLQNLKFAFDLEPENPEARIRYALVLMYAGNIEEANTVLSKGGNSLYFDLRVMNTLFYTNQNTKILSLWQERVEENPENPEFRKSLAAACIMNDNLSGAIKELEEIIKLRPEFKESADFMIAEIRAGRGQALITN
ncbi:MAG: O-antigen ligase family protein [Patescibacteria group bacterium]